MELKRMFKKKYLILLFVATAMTNAWMTGGSISGCKINDLDGNGNWDSGEPAIPGWGITLQKDGETVAQMQTGSDGCYTFSDLSAGVYHVVEEIRDGWTATSPTSLGGGFPINEGESYTDVNFLNKENPAPAISIAKAAAPATLPSAGGTMNYSYTVVNTGNISLSDINVTDDKCASVVFVSGDENNDQRLDAGEYWRYACQADITETTTNTAIATGRANERSVTSQVSVTVTVEAPDQVCVLNISKEVNRTGASVGDELEYRINFSNSGNADCTGGGVKIRDVVDGNLQFLSEEHSEDVSAGYGERGIYDESDRTLLWNAHTLRPGQAGWITWKGRINSPESCGNFSVSNTARITSYEYDNFNMWVTSNRVSTDISNECPVDTRIHLHKHTCASFSQIAGNAQADTKDDTSGRYTGFSNYSQNVPHFPDPYPATPISPNEVPGDCPAQAGWSFKLSTDQAQERDVTTVGETNNEGEFTVRMSELTREQQDTLRAGNPLWISEIRQESRDFGALRCFRDALYGDNLDFIGFDTSRALPEDVYCIAYNIRRAALPAPAPNPIISLSKSANPSSLDSSGGQVTYTYTVANPGDVVLTDIRLADDKCSAINLLSGDGNNDQKLDANETWKYDCKMNITENTTNNATVTGKAEGREVSARASATVTVAAPPRGGGEVIEGARIKIIKTPQPAELPVGGGTVDYTYQVKNPGQAAIMSVAIEDDKCSPVTFDKGDANDDKILDMSETWEYKCRTNIERTTTNVAKVTGFTRTQRVTDMTTATVTVGRAAPAISVEKAADKPNLPAGGGTINYFYTVKNPGPVALSDVSLTDDKCAAVMFIGGDNNNDQKLDTDEAWNYNCRMNLSETTTNIATAKGQAFGIRVTAQATLTTRVFVMPAEMPVTGGGGGHISENGGNLPAVNPIAFLILSSSVMLFAHSRNRNIHREN